jgi:hypothetical protein
MAELLKGVGVAGGRPPPAERPEEARPALAALRLGAADREDRAGVAAARAGVEARVEVVRVVLRAGVRAALALGELARAAGRARGVEGAADAGLVAATAESAAAAAATAAGVVAGLVAGGSEVEGAEAAGAAAGGGAAGLGEAAGPEEELEDIMVGAAGEGERKGAAPGSATPLGAGVAVLALRRERVRRVEGLAMAEGIGRLQRRGGLAVWLPEIDDSSDREIGMNLWIAAGEAGGRAAGGEDPVAGGGSDRIDGHGELALGIAQDA